MNIFNLKICFFFAALLSLNIFPQAKTDGWEGGSRYNKLFSNKIDTLTGFVIQIDHSTPMQGMSEGIQLRVQSGKDTVIVQLCPKWMGDYLNLNIKPKDEVIIEGCKAICKGFNVFMASKLTSNDIILQLRDEKGLPIWDRLR
jgi:hypothetical protein